MPFPGFPTDAQPIIMSMLTKANGTSVFIENIFENRFKHINELIKLGANITVKGNVSIVNGVNNLSGAKLQAHDLRGAASLLIAGLMSCGKTTIEDADYLLRGYDLNVFPKIFESINKN